MSIRIIVVTADANAAANVGGPIHVEYRSFEVQAPEVEAYVAANTGGPLCQRSIVGVELIPDLARTDQETAR